MRRPYYRKREPNNLSNKQSSTNLSALRERLLSIMLIGACVVGTFALISNLITDIPLGKWGIIILYAAAYVGLIFLTIFKKLAYLIRAVAFLSTIFILGVTATLTDGIAGNARIWFLGFIALSGILLSRNSGIYAFILASLTYLGTGGLMAGGVINIPMASSLPSSAIFLDWVNTGFVYMLVAVTIVITLSVIIHDINASFGKEHRLLEEISKEREELDKRTGELNRRLVQIRTAADISRTISAVLDQPNLLNQIADVVQKRFDLYYVGVFLLDDREEYAVLRAGTGSAGLQMIEEGHKLPLGGPSMVSWAITHRRARIALDVGEEAFRFNNPLLPKTRSEMALPLKSSDQVFGAMTVQSSKANAFDDDDITVLQGIADSLVQALRNARLFQQEKKNLEEIQALNRQYVLDAWAKVAANSDNNSYRYFNDAIGIPGDGLSEIHLPIALREQVIGQVSLELQSLELSSDDRAFIEQITNQAALALENVRLLEETQRRANHERLVTEIVKKARASADVDSIIRTTLGELGKSMQVVEGVIHLAVPEKKVASPDRSDL